MSLSGNLDVFPLEEVLRLLSRSHQGGCLRVEGPGAGRIYLERGAVTYASVESDEALRHQLLSAGIVTDESLRQAELSNSSLADAVASDAPAGALSEVIREQCVESLYRIRKPGSGPFAFSVDSRPRYVTGQSFDIEMLVAEADRRALEWDDIEQVVPDLSLPWHMVPELGEESVKLADTAWAFIAALQGSSSVEQVAARLGLTSFQAARRMAELSRSHLVEIAAAPAPAQIEVPSYDRNEVAYSEPNDWAVPAEPAAPVASAYDETPAWFAEEEEAVADEPASTETADAGSVAERSWWEEENPAVADEVASELDTAAEPAAEDANFLEGVFGNLEPESPEDSDEREESTEDDDNDDGAGFGLLRRRGLGAAFRELADS